MLVKAIDDNQVGKTWLQKKKKNGYYKSTVNEPLHKTGTDELWKILSQKEKIWKCG